MLEKFLKVFDKLSDKEDLIPLYHSILSTYYKLIINNDGTFNKAVILDNRMDQIVPSDIKCESRTATIIPYPIIDKLNYYDKNEKRNKMFIEKLSLFYNSEFATQTFNIYYNYVIGGTIINDLISCGILKSSDLSKMLNAGDYTTKASALCFQFWIIDENGEEHKLIDKNFSNNYIKYYEKYVNEGYEDLCYVTGEKVLCTSNCPTKILPQVPMAKLLICGSDFNIGLVASYKIHNALRWLIRHKSIHFGNLTYVIWSDEIDNKIPTPFSDRKKYGCNSELELITEKYKSNNLNMNINIFIIDCITTGRLSICGDYSIPSKEYFDNIYKWRSENKKRNTDCTVYDCLNEKNLNKNFIKSFYNSIINNKPFSPQIVNFINTKWKDKKIDDKSVLLFNEFAVKQNHTFKTLMEEKGINGNILSDLSGVKIMTIYDLKNGKTDFGNMKIDNAISIASAMEMTIEEVYEYLRE